MVSHPNRKRSTVTVKLVRQHSGFSNVDDAFSVLEPGYERAVDETAGQEIVEYYLPDGYSVGRARGETGVFDRDNLLCEIVMHKKTGRPQLISNWRDRPVLKRKPSA